VLGLLWGCEYASFRNLRVLHLSHNELVGTLPIEYAALDNLQVGVYAVVLFRQKFT
jgi:hypothetical protein